MIRMAKVYHTEGNLENAYILYIKFMTLFLEKIRQHPDFKTIPVSVKQPNQAKLKEILPITEKLKLKLLDQYKKEYSQFLANKEAEKINEAKKRSAVTPQTPKNKVENTTSYDVTLPDISNLNLNDVVYPNDFPSDPNRSNLPPGLILPDKPKPSAPLPSFDRGLKPSSSLADGELRTVVVPKDTMSKFLNLAKLNTEKNIETCGILAGKLAQNRLTITHVIIPKQSGTSDSCNTRNEEEIFDIQDQQNLITLGWIHVTIFLEFNFFFCIYLLSILQTHPSQTAFLSSVDLHTHCSYQIMMPEAIAIVCAPKYNT